MADNFGLKIGLEGEKEFKKALADINQSFKVLGSEMKLVSSQFDKNDNSVERYPEEKDRDPPPGVGERIYFLWGERPAHPAVADSAEQCRSGSE